MNRFVTNRTVQSVVRTVGIDPVQWALLLDLFGKLTDREEFEMGRSQVTRATLVGLFGLFLGIGNIIAVFTASPPLSVVVSVNFAVTGVVVMTILLSEALNTFLNPVEASVLAHQPIRDSSYIAAKFTHLMIVLASIVFPLNAIPAIVGLGLKSARWFYPATYLIAAYLLALCLGFAFCAVIGWLFRFVSPSRLRGIAGMVQALVFVFMFLIPRMGRLLASIQLPAEFTAINPLRWFVVFATIGQGPRTATFKSVDFLTIAVVAIFVIFGIRSLTKGYLVSAHLLLKSASARTRSSRGYISAIVRMVSGRPSGRAAFHFIYAMMRTDWQFRRTVIPAMIQVVMFPLIGVWRGLGGTPFGSTSPTIAHILPHLGGIIGLPLCSMLAYSDQYKAGWIFLTAPLGSLRFFARGVFWALLVPISAVPMLMLPFCIWFWGVEDALLFTAYSLGAGAMYLSVELFLMEGLPFGNPPRKGKGSLAAPLVFGAFIVAGIIVAFQWLWIFKSRAITVAATAAFVAIAFLISKVSLRNLETNVLHNLHTIASGPNTMFEEVE